METQLIQVNALINQAIPKLPNYGLMYKDTFQHTAGIASTDTTFEDYGFVEMETVFLDPDGLQNVNYYRLTDRWRQLKKLGSIEAFETSELEQQKEKDTIKELQKNSLISTINSAKFQKEMVWANTLIALSTLAAALYYLYEILRDYSEIDQDILFRFVVFGFVVILGVLVYKLTSSRGQKESEKQESLSKS